MPIIPAIDSNQRTENGFEIIDAGIQLFEKKAKEVKPDVGAAFAEAGVSS